MIGHKKCQYIALKRPASTKGNDSMGVSVDDWGILDITYLHHYTTDPLPILDTQNN